MSNNSNAKNEAQILAFEFLTNKFKSQDAFSKEDLRQAAGWSKSTFDTYWPKQLKQLLVHSPDGGYRVSESFLRVSSLKGFLAHVSQVRVVASDYSYQSYASVLQFEFFMPLSHEGYLRAALDGLFFRDAIIRRLSCVNFDELQERLIRDSGESREKYLERCAIEVSNLICGYSVSHVQGRYRSGDLKSLVEVAAEGMTLGQYLIDETTAVAKFIIPCESSDEAERKRWFFMKVFVEGVIQVINGEEEVWMLESGIEHRLHVWRIEK